MTDSSADENYASAESDFDFPSEKESSRPSSDSPSTAGVVTIASSSKMSETLGDKKILGVKEGNQFKYDSANVTFSFCREEINLYGGGKDIYFEDFVKPYKNYKPKSGFEINLFGGGKDIFFEDFVKPYKNYEPKSGYGVFDKKLVDKLADQNIRTLRPSQIATLQATFLKDPTTASEQHSSDFIGISSTGSGKTHAFLVPIVQQCLNRINDAPKNGKSTPLALIFAHTNTLVESIYERAVELVKGTPIIVKIIAGKYPYLQDTYFDIGVCSVGRFSNHFGKNTFSTMLFSATIHAAIMDFVDPNNYYEFNFGTPNSVALSIKQKFCQVNSRNITKITGFATGNIKIGTYTPGEISHPFDALYHSLNRINSMEDIKRTMVFVKRTCVADYIAQKLTAYGIKAIAVYGAPAKTFDNQIIEKRKRLLASFIDGTVKVLVATQLLTRGTDIEVDYVINYDLPVIYSEFIHRCGRTGRNQKTGTAITFVDFKNEEDYSPKVLQQIVLNTNQKFPSFLTKFVQDAKAAQMLHMQEYKEINERQQNEH
uniref:ATP-dependent RNA helicase n=1 Tax=Panagrolaimus sp. ES5 TaxID=591445 RepID=A0AC34GW89_9BILA